MLDIVVLKGEIDVILRDIYKMPVEYKVQSKKGFDIVCFSLNAYQRSDR